MWDSATKIGCSIKFCSGFSLLMCKMDGGDINDGAPYTAVTTWANTASNCPQSHPYAVRWLCREN